MRRACGEKEQLCSTKPVENGILLKKTAIDSSLQARLCRLVGEIGLC